MRYRVDDLSEPLLDYAVAMINGYGDTMPAGTANFANFQSSENFYPSTHWAHGGQIIERERINLCWKNAYPAKQWLAQASGHGAYGHTPLIAAMRCYVKSRHGDYIDLDVPDGV